MMVCVCWLLVVVMAYVCLPGFGSVCLDSSICKDLSNKQRILDCIHLCMSVNQTEYQELSALTLKVNEDDDGDDDDDDGDDDELLLSILLASLASEDKISESNLKDHGDQQRSYAMEHFRWGKPFGNKISDQKLQAHSNDRRSYSMEHFRWGKPSGRKRRPVKIFASPLEGSFLPLARRQLSSKEDEAKEDTTQTQESSRAKVSSKSRAQSQERKDANYRMSHFRWGSPRASRRNASYMKPWGKKPQGQLTKIFRNIVANDMQRITG